MPINAFGQNVFDHGPFGHIPGLDGAILDVKTRCEPGEEPIVRLEFKIPGWPAAMVFELTREHAVRLRDVLLDARDTPDDWRMSLQKVAHYDP